MDRELAGRKDCCMDMAAEPHGLRQCFGPEERQIGSAGNRPARRPARYGTIRPGVGPRASVPCLTPGRRSMLPAAPRKRCLQHSGSLSLPSTRRPTGPKQEGSAAAMTIRHLEHCLSRGRGRGAFTLRQRPCTLPNCRPFATRYRPAAVEFRRSQRLPITSKSGCSLSATSRITDAGSPTASMLVPTSPACFGPPARRC